MKDENYLAATLRSLKIAIAALDQIELSEKERPELLVTITDIVLSDILTRTMFNESALETVMVNSGRTN